MKTIRLEDVTILDRQREEFDTNALNQLASSIKEKGLLHAIVLQDDRKTLVAGERRLRAISSLNEIEIPFTFDGVPIAQGFIPYVVLGDLSADDLVEIELEENILREDLTYLERAQAIAKLHELRTGQKPGQTYKDTAGEFVGSGNLSRAATEVRDSLLLTEHATDPEISKAKSAKEALKLITKKKQAALTELLAKQFDITKTPHIFNNGDFRTHAHFIETGSVDVICTDPPYGVGADNFGDMAAATHGYNDTPEYFEEILNDFILEANRVTKSRAHMYVFCDIRQATNISEKLKRSGWETWNVPLIWNKGNGMLPEPDFGPRRNYEAIIFANKGRKPVTAVYSDVVTVDGIKAPRFGAQKPAEVYTNLLRRSVKPGDLIWDPFAGAGPVFVAANNLSVKVIASELIEEKYNFAKLRLNSTKEDENE